MKLLHQLWLTMLFIGLPAVSQAQLLFTLNPAGECGTPGTTVTFNATLANEGADTLFLNGVSFDGLPASLTVDTDPFFTNAPLSLAPADTWTGDLFAIQIDPAATLGPNIGSFSILGGSDDASQDILATQGFLVQVLQPAAATPEPGPVALLAGLAVPAALALRRARRPS